MNSKVSSAKWKFSVCLEVGRFPKPCMKPADWALVRILFNESAIKSNKKGDKGSPSLSPCLHLKKGPNSPLKEMQDLLPLSMSNIQLMNRDPKPLAESTSKRKSQFTLSKAFSKSNFSRRHFCLVALMWWSVSWALIILSPIRRPLMKAACESSMRGSMTVANLLGRSLVMNQIIIDSDTTDHMFGNK